MRTKLNLFLIIAILFCTISVSSAQHKLKITVIDEAATTLIGSTVALYVGDSVKAVSFSDVNGIVQFVDIPTNSYILNISMMGYQPYKQEITVNKNTTLPPISLILNQMTVSEITVKAYKEDNVQSSARSTVFHLSANALKNSMNAFEALREVPKLIVNPSNKTIQLQDGSSPLILVNGVNRPEYISSLDPADIEAVEVIENPSAKYRGDESIRSVINLVVKRKKQKYSSVSLSTKQNVGLVYGVTDGSFEIGNSKTSLYLNAQHFYFNNDKRDNEDYLRNGNFIRNTTGTSTYNSNMVYLNLGGDWIISPKDYLALGATYITNPSHTKAASEGTISENNEHSDLNTSQKINNNYFTNVYSLYYKHNFSTSKTLEITGKFGMFGSGSNGWRDEQSDLYSYYKDIDMDNNKKSYSLEANYEFNVADKVGFNIGSNTYYQQMTIADRASSFPDFDYNDLREYLFIGINNLGNHKFTYALSLGLDMVFTDADRVKNHYLNFVPNASLAYKFNKQNVLKLDMSRNRQSPSVSTLNPRNISTDSLQVSIGNPYLRPAVANKIRLSYEWSRKWLYISPYITYNYQTDMIEAYGESVENIYFSSYRNMGSHQSLRAGISSRIRFGDIGSLNFNLFYNKEFYDNYPYSGGALGASGNIYLSYKAFSLNVFAYYSGMIYTNLSKYISMPESEATIAWKISKSCQLSAGLRYFIPKFNYRVWDFNTDYESYNQTIYKNRRLMPSIGFSYNFRSKSTNSNRQKKQFYNTDEGINTQLK